MLDLLFQQLGFTDNESRVYLVLAELGKSSATLIAKQSGLPRSTAYSVLDQLKRRGLVSEQLDAAQTLYLVNPPSALNHMIEAERQRAIEEIKTREKAAEQLAERIEPFFKRQNFSVPHIQFFEGQANVESMLYDRCKLWQQSAMQHGNAWWGYQDHTFVLQYREWLEFYWSKAGIVEEQAFLFSNQSEVETSLKDQVPRRYIKLVPNEFRFSSTIWVAGEYVITIMTRQKPHYAFQLKDAVFASNQRNVFQLLWQSRE